MMNNTPVTIAVFLSEFIFPSPFLDVVVLIIYAALKSLVAVFADREAMADGLNPFTISQTAMTISCGANTISISGLSLGTRKTSNFSQNPCENDAF
jgi:hypothetical protein